MMTRIMALGLLLLMLAVAPSLVMLMLGIGFWWPLVIFTSGLGVTLGLAYVAHLPGIERVMYHVVGVGCVSLAGGLAYLAYNHNDRGITFLMLLIAAPFAYGAWGYLNGRRGADAYRGHLIQRHDTWYHITKPDGSTFDMLRMGDDPAEPRIRIDSVIKAAEQEGR